MLQNPQEDELNIPRSSPRHSHHAVTTIIGEATFKIMIEDKTKLNLLNTMMKIGGDDQNNNTDSSQPQLPSTRQSVGGIDDQNGATTNAEDDQGGLSGQSNAEKKKKRRSFSHVIQQTTMKPIMNISKGISSLQFKSRDVELRMNELLVYTVKDSHKNRKLKADLHLTHASITMDPLYKNCIKIETKEKILRVIIEDEGIRKGWFYSLNEQTKLLTKRQEDTIIASHSSSSLSSGGDCCDPQQLLAGVSVDTIYQPTPLNSALNQISKVDGMISEFINQINQMKPDKYFDPNSNLLAEPPTGRKRRLKFPSFEISGTTNDVLDSIQPSPSTGTTTAVDYSPLHSTQMKMEPIVKEHLSLLSTEFTNIQNFTFASAIAHLTMIGHTVMEKAQIEASTQSIINMTGGSTILKQGYLIKAGPNDHQPWKKRYCVLTEAREFRYLEDIGGAPKGLFSVENAWASRINDESIHIIPFATAQQALFTMGSSFASRRFLFKIETVDRVYKFEAPSYVSMKSWFQALELCGCHVKADENDGIILSGKLLKERMTTTTAATTTTTTSTSSGNAYKDESSHSSQWTPRHVVLLESNELKYYNKKGGTLLGTIKLEESYINRVTSGSSSGSGSATQAESSPNTSCHYRFKIYTPERTHQFETKDEETLQKWINTIVQYSAHSGGGEGCKLRNENDPEPIFKKKLNHFYLKSTEQVILEKQEKLQDYIVSEEKLKSKLMRNKSQASSSAKLNSSMRKAHNESLTLSEEGHRVEGSSSPMSEPPNSSSNLSPKTPNKADQLKRIVKNDNNNKTLSPIQAIQEKQQIREKELIRADDTSSDGMSQPKTTNDHPIQKTSSHIDTNINDVQEATTMERHEEYSTSPAATASIMTESKDIVPLPSTTCESPSTKETEETSLSELIQASTDNEEAYIPNACKLNENDMTRSHDSTTTTTTTTSRPQDSESWNTAEPRQSKELAVSTHSSTINDLNKKVSSSLKDDHEATLQQHMEFERAQELDEDHHYRVSNPTHNTHKGSLNCIQPTFVYEVVQGLSPTIVIDNGSGVLKAGFVDEEYPSAVFNNMIGRLKEYHAKGMIPSTTSAGNHVGQQLYFGDGAQALRSLLSLSYPVEKGIVKNFEDCEMMLQYTQDCLGLESFSEHPVLMTESPDNPKAKRERQTQMMFETFDVPYLYMAKSAVLALFAYGSVTGMCLDSGDGVTHVVPIYEGYSLPHAVNRLNLAGKDLTHYMMQLLNEREFSSQLFTTHGGTTAAFEIVRCLKEELCEVSESTSSTSPTVNYELPDGSSISVGNERFKCPELLFNPSLTGNHDSLGIVELCKKTIYDTDIDLRKTLAHNIFLAGGSTKFKGLQARLQNDLQEALPYSQKVRVKNSTDSQHLAWIGGSILGKMSRFTYDAMSREEYDEMGPCHAHIKFM